VRLEVAAGVDQLVPALRVKVKPLILAVGVVLVVLLKEEEESRRIGHQVVCLPITSWTLPLGRCSCALYCPSTYTLFQHTPHFNPTRAVSPVACRTAGAASSRGCLRRDRLWRTCLRRGGRGETARTQTAQCPDARAERERKRERESTKEVMR